MLVVDETEKKFIKLTNQVAEVKEKSDKIAKQAREAIEREKKVADEIKVFNENLNSMSWALLRVKELEFDNHEVYVFCERFGLGGYNETKGCNEESTRFYTTTFSFCQENLKKFLELYKNDSNKVCEVLEEQLYEIETDYVYSSDKYFYEICKGLVKSLANDDIEDINKFKVDEKILLTTVYFYGEEHFEQT